MELVQRDMVRAVHEIARCVKGAVAADVSLAAACSCVRPAAAAVCAHREAAMDAVYAVSDVAFHGLRGIEAACEGVRQYGCVLTSASALCRATHRGAVARAVSKCVVEVMAACRDLIDFLRWRVVWPATNPQRMQEVIATYVSARYLGGKRFVCEETVATQYAVGLRMREPAIRVVHESICVAGAISRLLDCFDGIVDEYCGPADGWATLQLLRHVKAGLRGCAEGHVGRLFRYNAAVCCVIPPRPGPVFEWRAECDDLENRPSAPHSVSPFGDVKSFRTAQSWYYEQLAWAVKGRCVIPF